MAVAVVIFFAARTTANPPGVTGRIVAIDSVQYRVQVVDYGGLEYWFNCVESTVYTLNGFAASFNELAPGQHVDVKYEPDTFIVIQVDATSPSTEIQRD